MLRIIHALIFWYHYLLGIEFKNEISHQSLWCLTSQTNLNFRQSRWIELMQKINFKIQCVKRVDYVLADSLSHRPFVNAVDLLKNIILNSIKPFYTEDVFFSTHFASLLKETRTQEAIDK